MDIPSSKYLNNIKPYIANAHLGPCRNIYDRVLFLGGGDT